MNNLQSQQYLDRPSLTVSFVLISKTFITYLIQGISQYLNNSDEPRVWRSKSRQGEVIWHIYHPKTNQKAHFTSEQEALQWIEEQYYYYLSER